MVVNARSATFAGSLGGRAQVYDAVTPFGVVHDATGHNASSQSAPPQAGFLAALDFERLISVKRLH